jgi:hypothetical protein
LAPQEGVAYVLVVVCLNDMLKGRKVQVSPPPRRKREGTKENNGKECKE